MLAASFHSASRDRSSSPKARDCSAALMQRGLAREDSGDKERKCARVSSHPS